MIKRLLFLSPGNLCFEKMFLSLVIFVLPIGRMQTLNDVLDCMCLNLGHYPWFTFRKRTPKAPVQNKERKKSDKRKPQTMTVSDESEELESEVRNV